MATYYIQRQTVCQAIVEADSDEEALALAFNDPELWDLIDAGEDTIVEIE